MGGGQRAGPSESFNAKGSPMGYDLIPAMVINNTDIEVTDNSIWLLVVDGDILDSQWPPKAGDFYWVAPGSNSKGSVRSIDAFGAYASDETPLEIVYNGRKSSWWKIPDGMDCSVYTDAAGVLKLEVIGSYFGAPEPTAAADWNYHGH